MEESRFQGPKETKRDLKGLRAAHVLESSGWTLKHKLLQMFTSVSLSVFVFFKEQEVYSGATLGAFHDLQLKENPLKVHSV